MVPENSIYVAFVFKKIKIPKKQYLRYIEALLKPACIFVLIKLKFVIL